MGILKEFKEFATKGNVVDLAVAVVMGAAFGAIITSFVGDVLTPLILAPALKQAGVDSIEKLSSNGVLYGKFIASIINFLFISLALFLLVKGINKMKKAKVEDAAPSTTDVLLTEIRDALKK